MSSFLVSVLAFLAVLGPLVVVHEFGHFWVARRAGVKILRFSVGFGPTLWQKVFGADRTELVLAGIPLGGYVKMLDEREGEVAPEELSREFTRKPLAARAAIVVAGPVFNLLLAVVAFWGMYTLGIPGIKPKVAEVLPNSAAARAGLRADDLLLEAQGHSVPTLEAFKHASIPALLSGEDLTIKVQDAQGSERDLSIAAVNITADDLARGDMLEQIGFKPALPQLPAIIAEVLPGMPAEQSGMRAGDQVVAADGAAITTWDQWVAYVQARPETAIAAVVRRGDQEVTLNLRPLRELDRGKAVGRIGAKPRAARDPLDASFVAIERYGVFAAIPRAIGETWDTTRVTLKFLYKMVSGQASAKNLGGPISIAQSAGATAKLGLGAFLSFIAVISVSLAVLNLLPIPILDGGHLMYYLIELVGGKPISLDAQRVGQQLGILILGFIMCVAFYNDLVRVFG